jgi:hypothetical protein
VKTLRTPSSRDKCKAREGQSETHASRGEADRAVKSDDITDPFLRHAVENKVMGLDGLQAARLALVKLFGRIERMSQEIDLAFGGQPFLPDLPPTCPANRRRFNTFARQHEKVTQLLGYALELWSFACGLKPGDDWVPALIADMNRSTIQEALRQDPKPNTPLAPGLRLGTVLRLRREKPTEHRSHRLMSADPTIFPPTRIELLENETGMRKPLPSRLARYHFAKQSH